MQLLNNFTHQEVLKLLKESRLIIYGAGAVANYFWLSLKAHKIEDRVADVMVTHVGSHQFFHGKLLKTLQDTKLKTGDLVCLAVHDSQYTSLIDNLKSRSENISVIWIKPYCQGGFLEAPIKRKMKVPIRELLYKYINPEIIDYNFALRWLVLEQVMGYNNVGNDLYLKSFRIFSTVQSAEKRLKRFIELFSDWRKFGYDKSCCVYVDEDYCLIDGVHRTTIAAYEGLDFIYADIYPVFCYKQQYFNLFSMPRTRLESHGFSTAELLVLENARQEIYRRIDI